MTTAKPLQGLKVVEFAGLAPGPFAGMVLADFGADVIRIDRPDIDAPNDVLCRNKRSIAVTPKTKAGLAIIKKLIASADVVIDPFRPGALEKLGLGPTDCMRDNPRLVYARMAGYTPGSAYGQMAGHDINYIALSGLLATLRPNGGMPYPPINLLGDFAGGGMVCVLGILVALLARQSRGKGQVVQADMVTGTRYVSSFVLLSNLPSNPTPLFGQPPGQNGLDGGSPFYSVYAAKDGKFITVGALEPRFYAIFLERLIKAVGSDPVMRGMKTPQTDQQFDRDSWPALRAYFTKAFLTKSRDEWEALFIDTDACVAPVLEPAEVAQRSGQGRIPALAPQLSDMQCTAMPQHDEVRFLRAGQHTQEILKEIGYDNIDSLKADETIKIARAALKRASKL